MEDRFHELAMLKLAERASKEESSELDGLLADSPEFRAEYELLQKEVPAIKELIPMVKTPETSDEEMPVYEKTALLTEIEEIFGKQEQADKTKDSKEQDSPSLGSDFSSVQYMPAGTRFMPAGDEPPFTQPPPPRTPQESHSCLPWLIVASAIPVIVALMVLVSLLNKDDGPPPIAQTHTPVIQLAMLDIVGETRGEGNETAKTFKEAWPKAAYENYSEIDPAKAWRGQWADNAKAPQVKILYDVTEAEITVLGKWKGETKTETLLVDDNLAEVLQKAKDLIQEWYGEENE